MGFYRSVIERRDLHRKEDPEIARGSSAMVRTDLYKCVRKLSVAGKRNCQKKLKGVETKAYTERSSFCSHQAEWETL